MLAAEYGAKSERLMLSAPGARSIWNGVGDVRHVDEVNGSTYQICEVPGAICLQSQSWSE